MSDEEKINNGIGHVQQLLIIFNTLEIANTEDTQHSRQDLINVSNRLFALAYRLNHKIGKPNGNER